MLPRTRRGAPLPYPAEEELVLPSVVAALAIPGPPTRLAALQLLKLAQMPVLTRPLQARWTLLRSSRLRSWLTRPECRTLMKPMCRVVSNRRVPHVFPVMPVRTTGALPVLFVFIVLELELLATLQVMPTVAMQLI